MFSRLSIDFPSDDALLVFRLASSDGALRPTYRKDWINDGPGRGRPSLLRMLELVGRCVVATGRTSLSLACAGQASDL